MPRLSELVYGIKLKGPQVKLPQIEGADVDVTAVGFFEAEFAPGAAVQIKGENGQAWVVTFSQVIIETLALHQDKLPFTATFTSHKSASDRTYWTIE